MSRSKAAAGVIGLGPHGLRHLEAYQRLGEAEVIAVCDVNPDRVSLALEKFPYAKGYKSWQNLLEDQHPDILSVVTNGPSHAAITIAAAESGIRRILCEKPMATSVGDAVAIVRACSSNGTRLAVGHSRRWSKTYRRFKDLIADGLIGKLCHMSFTCGGGLFACNGSHILDLMRLLSGANPVLVIGFMEQNGRPNPRGKAFVDPGATALYRFDNGMVGVIDMREDLRVPPRLELVGSSGRVIIDEASDRWEIKRRQDEDLERPVQHHSLALSDYPFSPSPLDVVEFLVAALAELLGETEISCTGEDGLAVVEQVIGAHVSSQNGNVPVRLPLAESYHHVEIPFT